jgi:hypothetical protein
VSQMIKRIKLEKKIVCRGRKKIPLYWRLWEMRIWRRRLITCFPIFFQYKCSSILK